MSGLSCLNRCKQPPKFFGCFSSCVPQTLPIMAPVDGDYIIKYWKQGTLIEKVVTITGAPVYIETNHVFPENSDTVFSIIDPAGNILKYNLLRDKLGVKDIQNFPDSNCCSECETVFYITTYYSFSLPDDEPELTDPCE